MLVWEGAVFLKKEIYAKPSHFKIEIISVDAVIYWINNFFLTQGMSDELLVKSSFAFES